MVYYTDTLPHPPHPHPSDTPRLIMLMNHNNKQKHFMNKISCDIESLISTPCTPCVKSFEQNS